MTTALLFAASGVLIVVAAELFTNAVEWAGFLLGLTRGATGSLLAALGTSLPETAVPVVALATHSPSADSVAQGAVLGAPFLLLTIAAGITGVAVWLRGGARRLEADPSQTRRDLGVFLVAFSIALVAMALPNWARIVVGVALLGLYTAYVLATLRGGGASTEMPEPLHIIRWRSGPPTRLLVAVQLLVAVVLLVVGSELFIDALNRVATALRIAALVLALVVVPLATELPETSNSVLWVRSRDDTLAFGNVAGSATFQACVLGFLGVTFTSWNPGGAGVISGLLTVASAAFLLIAMRRGPVRATVLMLAALPWCGYAVGQFVTGGRLGG